eukprot:940550-Rhodomonas_salina.1
MGGKRKEQLPDSTGPLQGAQETMMICSICFFCIPTSRGFSAHTRPKRDGTASVCAGAQWTSQKFSAPTANFEMGRPTKAMPNPGEINTSVEQFKQ